MNRQLLTLMWVLCAVPLLAAKEGGCAGAEDSATVAQDRIFTSYWLFYDANTDTTSARATFRFGNELGTILELLPPAKVTFNGQPMAFDDNLGWHAASLSGSVVGTFEYTDTGGRTFTVEVAPITPIDFPERTITLQRGKSATFAWAGAPLAKDEGLEVYVTADSPLIFQRFDQNAEGATNLVLAADKLARVSGTETGAMSLRRWGTRPAKGTSAGATLRVTHQPKDASVRYLP